MFDDFEKKIKKSIQKAFELDDEVLKNFNFSSPPQHVKSDLSIVWPIAAAKILKMSPMKIAEKAANTISHENVESIEVAPPGFINMKLKKEFLLDKLSEIITDSSYFKNPDNAKENINIEFVSANPTGPMHLASGRGATLGDSLVKMFNFMGYKASSEFYVNNMGRQVELLGQSLKARFLGEDVPENGYKGEYLKEMASGLLPDAKTWADKQFSDFALKKMISLHKKDMKNFGIEFNRWFLESELYSDNALDNVKTAFKEKNMIYEKEGALWFGSSNDEENSDDKDRVLVKSDGRNTYFLSDIAYHLNKYGRGFSRLIDIWGADHHGYVPRMKAAVAALGEKTNSFEIIIHQQVSLKRGNEVLKMSKREGNFISLKELTENVGKDACRFFFAMRSPGSHLNFDVDLAQKKSNENPVFYVQYVHARICSIFDKAARADFDINAIPDFGNIDLNDEEKGLLNKFVWFEKVLNNCIADLTPHHLPTYLMELAGLFHSFYDKHKVVDAENPETTQVRLFILRGVKFVINEGLNLIGVSAPEKM